ncbi:YdaS antitoxin of YdaST toxin-antitoxin system [Modicisalibacter xianhensis]|uniref:YdaS antitoxin of YdaST toxin-antitoxin system n=1 Tax=Modicisalibacter xianhensis TaxID=442341 RepID=A0A4R8G419_9GAMM|nr:YdaS family helix-turn-helix protein [Halomonas xianhensis]TDX30785.1 YdaS antitoxin of YdaST toxin-antitoxin system [Halomonas xianhensis]
MKINAIDMGAKPADVLSGKTISPAEKAHRQKIARQAWECVGSYRRLAELIGTSKPTVSRWVNGKYPVPTRFVGALQDVIERSAA